MIVLIDDHKVITDSISSLILEKNFSGNYMVLNTGEQFYALFKKTEFELALIDIELKSFNGIHIARDIKQRYPLTKVVFFTMNENARVIQEALALDVEGYILKNDSILNIEKGIHSVLNGEHYYSESVLQLAKSASITKGKLTKRELEILDLVSEGKTNLEIAETLFLSIETVKTHRKNIARKLDGVKPLQFWLKSKIGEYGV